MTSRAAMVPEHCLHVPRRPLLTTIGLTLGLVLGVVSEARASTYRVNTNSAATAMNVSTSDGVCSLAEAVLHVNGKNNGVKYCDDYAAGSTEHRIELLQSSGKTYAANHYKISTLTITSSKRLTIAGSGAFIDSTGVSAFVVGASGAATQPTVFFERVTLTNTAGSTGGRLVENYGTLQLYGVTITKGDVTGSRHATGRGGGIYNAGTISFAQNSLITANKAKLGGGIYNDAGTISDLIGTIVSLNSATRAGGGIYNAVITPASGAAKLGTILTGQVQIVDNSARAGGGVFNRGRIELTASVVSRNSTTASGTSDETCNGVSCDGSGGGVVSVHVTNSRVATRFNLTNGSELSRNVATARGGGVSSAGSLELTGILIEANSAPDGGAVYAVSVTDGTPEYCNIAGDVPGGVSGPTQLYGNFTTGSSGFSILGGGPINVANRCTFGGLDEGFLTAGGNSAPTCNADLIHSGHRCPQ